MLAARARRLYVYSIERVHASKNLYSSKLALPTRLRRQSSWRTTDSSGYCSAVQASASVQVSRQVRT